MLMRVSRSPPATPAQEVENCADLRTEKQKRPAQPLKGTGRTITMQAEENAHGIEKQDDNLIMVFADEQVALLFLDSYPLRSAAAPNAA